MRALEQSYTEQLVADCLERYERKWVMDQTSSIAGKALIQNLPLVLTETFTPRSVHSLYFDTEDFLCFQLHESGSRNRYKVRIRWYGDLFADILEAQLEIKIRNERMVKKLTYKLGQLYINELFLDNCSMAFKANLPKDVAELCRNLKPKVFTSYDRRYFATYGGKVRVTFDSNLCFYKFSNNKQISMNGMMQAPMSIIELKYPVDLNSELSPYFSSFPGAQTRNSKYTTGVKSVLGL